MADTQSANQNTYIGHGKKQVISTQDGGQFEIMKMSLTEEDVKTLQGNLDNGWVNFDIKARRAPSPSGFTHYGQLNTWKPKTTEGEASSKPAATPPVAPAGDEISADDLPF